MAKRILVLDGHPGAESLIDALATRYAEAAAQAGAEVRRVNVRDLAFDPNLGAGYKERLSPEPDLQAAMDDLAWCQHAVVFFPTWWGATPALLKGFFDRALLPGFAFRYRPDGIWWDRLMKSRSARIVTTQHTPWWFNATVQLGSNVRSVKRQTLGFVGFAPVRVTVLSWFRRDAVPAERFFRKMAQVARRDAR